jgi:hypothetical protein
MKTFSYVSPKLSDLCLKFIYTYIYMWLIFSHFYMMSCWGSSGGVIVRAPLNWPSFLYWNVSALLSKVVLKHRSCNRLHIQLHWWLIFIPVSVSLITAYLLLISNQVLLPFNLSNYSFILFSTLGLTLYSRLAFNL